MATDRFGGIALDEPPTDKFGGVAVEEPQFTTPRQPYFAQGTMPTTVGGPRAKLAPLFEALVEPKEEFLNPRFTTPKPQPVEGEPALTTVGKEAWNIASSVPEFLSSDPGLLTVAGSGGGLGKLVAGGFSASMFYDMGRQIVQNYKNWNKMTETQKRVAVVDLIGTGVFAGLAGHAAVKQVAPLTAKAVEETIKPKEPSAQTIPGDQEKPAVPRQEPQGGQADRSRDVQQAPPGTPDATAQEKEVLTHAAYQDEEGNVFKGANHPEILERLGIKGFDTRESRNTPQFGFATNKRSFVPREEATEIGKVSGQNLADFEEGHPLHSDETLSVTEPGKTIGDQKETPPAAVTGEAQPTVPAAGTAEGGVSAPPAPATPEPTPEGQVTQGGVSTPADEVEKAKAEQPIKKGIHFVRSKSDLDKILSEGFSPSEGMGNYVSFYHEGNRPRDFGIGRKHAVIIEFPANKGGSPKYEGGIEKANIKSVREATPEEISQWGKTPVQSMPGVSSERSTESMLVPSDATIATPQSSAKGAESLPTLTPTESTRLKSLTEKLESGQPLTGAEQKRYRALKDKVSPPEVEKPSVESQPPTTPPSTGEGMAGPGSPSAKQGPDVQTSELRQLTDFIRNQSISPKQSVGERISDALRLADRWAKGKDAVSQSLGRARAASRAALDAYANLPAWRSFEETIGRWIGADQKTSLEVRNFQKAINKAVPNRLRQEAITNWIQADGDEALLRGRAQASKPGQRRGYEAALTLNDAEKALARNISTYLDARLEEGQQAGLLKQGVDNYITQIWKRPTSATNKLWADLFGYGTLNPNFKYARQRIFESYFEGEQAGFIPKDKRVGSLIGAYDLAFNKALSARAMIRELHKGKAADGLPITMTSGKSSPVPAGDAPPEAFLIKPNQVPKEAVTVDGRPYRPIDHWALRDWKWATKGPEGQNVFVQGDMLVHPDHWMHLNNILKSSRLAQHPVTRFMLQAGALAKQTKLSLSPFHAVQEGVHALAHQINPANTVELNLDDPVQRSLVDHGLMVADPRAQELFSEGMTGGGLVTKIPGLGHLQAAFNDLLFKDYIPRLKMSMAIDALARNREAYAADIRAGKVTDDQIVALTAREANAAFGEQNYKMMGRSPNVQDFFRLALLAPDFLEARGRFVGQALKPYGREQRIALALMGATLYVGGRIMNQWLDNDPHWTKPFSLFYKGREYRLRTILGDVQHLITDPRSFWFNRMSPWIRTAVEYATGRDDRGIKRNHEEQLADAASWFKPIPLQTRSDTTLTQAILSASGIPSKAYGAQQQLYEILDKWKSSQKDPKLAEQYDQQRKETHADSPYKPLRDALTKDDSKAAKAAYHKLLSTHTKASIDRALRSNRPFAGSMAAERAFLSQASESEKKVYAKAVEERRELYRRFKAMLSTKHDQFGGIPVEATP